MQQLPASLKDKTNPVQKLLALGLLGLAVYWAAKGVNAIAPTLIEACENVLIAVPLLAITGFVLFFIFTQPMFIFGLFKTLVWKLTKFFIKMDPLSVMDRYVEYLVRKLTSLRGTITVLTGKKSKLERSISELNDKILKNQTEGKAAIKLGNTNAASSYGIKVQTDESTLKLLNPLLTRLLKNLGFLEALAENWEFGIEKLKYQIEGKRQEFEIIKETHKGLKSAEDFISSDSESAKLYGESIKQLEEQVTQKIGFIEDFEKRSKGIMDNISIEKQSIKDEGLLALEQSMNQNLMLPDFSQVQVVSSQPLTNNNKFFK